MTHHKDHPIEPHHRTHQTPAFIPAFIARLLPVAQAVKKKWGVPIAVLIAQGGLESSWGQAVKGNAYFGIKGKSPSGTSVNFATHEVSAGKSVPINDDFRSYTSLEEAADDYGRFLKTNPNYAACWAYPNQPELFADHLTYFATDPDYTTKIKKIIRDYHLIDYDANDPGYGTGPFDFHPSPEPVVPWRATRFDC